MALLLASSGGSAGTQAPADGPVRGAQVWEHVRVLADDATEGRRAGSEGHRRAADYVAEQFRRAGLAPGWNDKYLQPVELLERRIDEPASSLALVRGATVEPRTLGEDALLSLRGNFAPAVEAPLVFAGYGLRIPEHHVDELTGLDLRGKVVVAFLAAPVHVPGAVQAHNGSPVERWKRYRAAGAVGVVFILNPFSMDLPWKRTSLMRLEPYMSLADPALDEFQGQKLWVVVNPARGERFFAGSGHSYPDLLNKVRDGAELPRGDLPARVRARITATATSRTSQNVVGVLRGSDRRLREEAVVLSAHLDHLGVGGADPQDRIFNGAMDNASGVATLIEVARSLRASRHRPRRSIAFVAVTAEETGLLGSRYYVTRAAAARSKIVANLNSDMFLPLFPLERLIVFGLEESDLADDVRAAAAPLSVIVQTDPEPLRNRFIRSDQYSFIRFGIPSLALKLGFEPGSPQAAIELEWFAKRYHAPSDDLSQPVDLGAAGRYVELLETLARRVADRSRRPAWRASSAFSTTRLRIDSTNDGSPPR
jgi:hypothetical protein